MSQIEAAAFEFASCGICAARSLLFVSMQTAKVKS
jgi:hypothetical protein